MANPNPIAARLAKRSRARTGRDAIELQDVRVILSDVLEMAAEHLKYDADGNPPSVEQLSKIGYLVSQLSGTYAKLLEVGEHESRLTMIQEQIDELQKAARNSRIPA